MTMHTFVTERIKDIEKFVNDNGIDKEDIVSIFPKSDKEFVLTYYSED